MDHLTNEKHPTYVNYLDANTTPPHWGEKTLKMHQQDHRMLCRVLPGWNLKPRKDFVYTCPRPGLKKRHGMYGIWLEMYRGTYGPGEGTGLRNVFMKKDGQEEMQEVTQDEAVRP